MKHVRVLVIDDSLTIRAILESILSRHPDIQIVGLASDIESARAMLDEERPDVITLDLALPGMDGFAFLEELASYPHAPVLVVSSSTRDGSEIAADALKRGADGCFDKARLVVESDRFLRVLRKAVSRRRSRVIPAKAPAMA